MDDLYRNYERKGVDYRKISNILTVNRKLFECGVLDTFANIHGCVSIANKTNHDITKVRYYHDGEYYDPHTDKSTMFPCFSPTFTENLKNLLVGI